MQNSDSEKVDVLSTDEEQNKDQILSLLKPDNSDDDPQISKEVSDGDMASDTSSENSVASKQSVPTGVNSIAKDTIIRAGFLYFKHQYRFNCTGK